MEDPHYVDESEENESDFDNENDDSDESKDDESDSANCSASEPVAMDVEGGPIPTWSLVHGSSSSMSYLTQAFDYFTFEMNNSFRDFHQDVNEQLDEICVDGEFL